MCVVSAVTDHYQQKWGNPWTQPVDWLNPNIQPFKPSPSFKFISEEEWQEYQRLKRAAQEIDEKTSQPDCIKPELEEWENLMTDFLRRKGILKE